MDKETAMKRSKTLCLQMLRRGCSPYQCRKRCKEKYGYTVSSSWLYARYHEIKGDAPEPPVRKLGRNVLQQERDDFEGLLASLISAMKDRGLETVTVHVSGRVVKTMGLNIKGA